MKSLPSHDITRRGFLAGSSAIALALAGGRTSRANDGRSSPPEICAFIKFIQSYSYDELAEKMANAGFSGIEATIRKGGYIEPISAADELPKLVDALKKHGLQITILTSNITQADDSLTEPLLRTASSLGIKRYRMGYYRYDKEKGVLGTLDEIRPAIKDLTVLNQELGIQALYQNHSGARTVGAPVWDIHYLIKDLPVEFMAMAFDIRHATVEGGSSWPLHYQLMQPHVGAIYVKDFVWNRRNVKNVRLGTGQIDPRFFEMVQQTGLVGPYSLHVEYLGGASTQDNYQALVTDLRQLKNWLPM